jgi:hypothetical protein
MIALITSTLIPNKNSYSFFSNEERIRQTELTINKLLELAFDSIYIFDNSDEKTDINTISPLFSKNSNIKFYHNDQYAFKNNLQIKLYSKLVLDTIQINILPFLLLMIF